MCLSCKFDECRTVKSLQNSKNVRGRTWQDYISPCKWDWIPSQSFISHMIKKLFPVGWMPQYVAEQWTTVTNLLQSRISWPWGKTSYFWRHRNSLRWLMHPLPVLTPVQDTLLFFGDTLASILVHYLFGPTMNQIQCIIPLVSPLIPEIWEHYPLCR